MEVGFGEEAQRGDTCDVAYEVFTQGGLYPDSVGFGMVRRHETAELSSDARAVWAAAPLATMRLSGGH